LGFGVDSDQGVELGMKIAFVVSRFPSLSETFVLNQITGLIDRGHEVEIFSSQRPDLSKVHVDVQKYDLLAKTCFLDVPSSKSRRLLQAIPLLVKNLFKYPGTTFKAINFFRFGRRAMSFRLLFEVDPFLGKEPYDVIHCHFGPNGVFGVSLREAGAIKGAIVTSFHGYDVNISKKTKGYSQLFKHGDLFTVNTDFTKGRVIDLGCAREKIVKLPVGLDMKKFVFKLRGINAGETVRIITVGRLVEKKGIEYSIKAIDKVIRNHPDWNILYEIAGDGPLGENLNNCIRKLGLENQVRLLGPCDQNEVRDLYQEAHIFILSSVTSENGDREGQALVLQEAQAVGLPVLSTLHNGIPEGVLDGESGFLVPERDVDALAERLEYLINNPGIWPKMGRSGRKFVETNYDLENLNDQLVNLYSQLIEGEIQNSTPFS